MLAFNCYSSPKQTMLLPIVPIQWFQILYTWSNAGLVLSAHGVVGHVVDVPVVLIPRLQEGDHTASRQGQVMRRLSGYIVKAIHPGNAA